MKRSTRGIKLDYAKIGEKLIMSSSTCHRCRVTIADSQSTVFSCFESSELKKRGCDVRFCEICVKKYHQNLTQQDLCPVCSK